MPTTMGFAKMPQTETRAEVAWASMEEFFLAVVKRADELLAARRRSARKIEPTGAATLIDNLALTYIKLQSRAGRKLGVNAPASRVGVRL